LREQIEHDKPAIEAVAAEIKRLNYYTEEKKEDETIDYGKETDAALTAKLN
jgi:hypothetical protein